MNRNYAYILVAVFGLSFILVFSTLLLRMGMSSFEQLFFRLFFGFCILLVVMAFRRNVRLIQVRDVPFFLAIGFVYAWFTLSGLAGVAFGTLIPVSVALVYTQPIFTAIIAQATGKESVSVAKSLIILLGVFGVFLVSGIQSLNVRSPLGLIFPILAGLLYAIYLWLKRQAPTVRYTPYQVLANTFMVAIPFILVFWFILRNFVETPAFTGVTTTLDGYQLVLLLMFASFSTILPYGLLNYVKPREISPTTEGLLLLGDPILHTTWATLFLQEFITPIQYLGAGLILTSAALSLRVGGKKPRLG